MAPVGFLPLWPQTSNLQHEGVVLTVKTLLTVSALCSLPWGIQRGDGAPEKGILQSSAPPASPGRAELSTAWQGRWTLLARGLPL